MTMQPWVLVSFGSLLTSGYHNVSQTHRRLDVLFERRLHKFIILLDDALDVPPSFSDVPSEPPYQPDVRVRVHKDLHVQELR